MVGWDVGQALTAALLGVCAYFATLTASVVRRHLRFRRMRNTAALSWPAPPPPYHRLGLALGILNAILTLAAMAFHARLPQTLSHAAVAGYFLLAVPLLASIRPGFYGPGLWAEATFVPYGQVGRWAFHDAGPIVLVILRRGVPRALRLPIPPDDYGAVCKLLQQKADEHTLRVDPAILDLSQS